MITGREALKSVTKQLESCNIIEPEAKAKIIVSHVLNIEFSELFTYGEIPTALQDRINEMTSRCSNGEPVEYVTGKAYFRYAVLGVSQDVLIPRAETELVAQCAIDMIKKHHYKTAIDMCTGSGCIAISLAMETDIMVDASDISKKALTVATKNTQTNGVFDKVNLFISDMFEDIDKSYDLIVSNPPYVSETEYQTLDDSVRLYEPKLALTAEDGLKFYRTIANKAMHYLNAGGGLVLEIGAGQAESVTQLLKQNGFCGVEYKQDYQGRDRIVSAYKLKTRS